MEIKKVISVTEPSLRNVYVCPTCSGLGWYWSDLDFGDIPGDEVKITCTKCAGTGRMTTLHMVVEAVVPFDYKMPE